MPIRAVTFDFWCTLFRDGNSAEPRQEILISALEEATGAFPAAIKEALAAVLAEGVRTPVDAVRRALFLLHVPLDEETEGKLTNIFATAILTHAPQPIEGALEAVRMVAQYWPVGIVSNTGLAPGSSLRIILDRNGIGGIFGAKVFSDEVGVKKPQPLMFETAARSLGVKADELLHIGDQEPTDVEGAKGVGAKTILFAGDKARYANTTRADYTFASWRAFLDALHEIRSLFK